MRKQKFLPINITKATVVAIALTYKEKQLQYSAEVSLVSEFGKPITSVYVSNNSWDEKDKAELTLNTIALANSIRTEIETCVIKFMNSKQGVIGELK